MTAANFLQLLVSGLAMGAIYSLSAKGLFIAHLATHRLNFGQGDFLMVGAFLMIALLSAGVPAGLSALVTLAASAALGVVLVRVAITPTERSGDQLGGYSWILTTAGFALILQNIVELIWGKSTQYAPPIFSSTRDNVIRIFGIGIFVEEAAVIIVALCVVIAFYVFLYGTRWGRAIYVVAFNRETASLLGINVRRTVMMVFVVAALLAGISGILVGPLVSVNPRMGLVFTIKALAVASIGGFVNPAGILAGGLAFGIIESFSNYWDSDFGDLYPLVAVMVLLAVKPQGLIGARTADVR
jgi:branched-chain amino acid transport system permease protein